MRNYKDEGARGSAVKQGVSVVFRALRSTVVIGAVAVVASAARSGDFRWGVITRLAWAYRVEFAMIFVGLVIWEFWVARAKRRRGATE